MHLISDSTIKGLKAYYFKSASELKINGFFEQITEFHGHNTPLENKLFLIVQHFSWSYTKICKKNAILHRILEMKTSRGENFNIEFSLQKFLNTFFLLSSILSTKLLSK